MQSIPNKNVKDFFNEFNVNFVSMRLVKDHPFSRILARSGFVDSRGRPHTSFMPLLGGSDQFDLFMRSKPEQVHYVYGEKLKIQKIILLCIACLCVNHCLQIE